MVSSLPFRRRHDRNAPAHMTLPRPNPTPPRLPWRLFRPNRPGHRWPTAIGCLRPADMWKQADATGRSPRPINYRLTVSAHWAYCRMVEVVQQINARPRTAQEWDAIESEIVKIERLTPPNVWYAKYLRSKVAEMRRGGRRAEPKTDNLIVRGSPPDEKQDLAEPDSRRFPRLFGRSRSATPAKAPPADTLAANRAEMPLSLPQPSATSPPEAASPRAQPAAELDSAMPREAGSIAIARCAGRSGGRAPGSTRSPTATRLGKCSRHPISGSIIASPRLAEAAGQAAEAVRAAQAKRWASPAVQRPWTPRARSTCTRRAKSSPRKPSSRKIRPAFRPWMCNGNRVVARRMNLRADHPQVVDGDPAARSNPRRAGRSLHQPANSALGR